MLCCKIISDFNDHAKDFTKLCDDLSKNGEILWNNNSLYFYSVKTSISENKINKILRACGYTHFFLNIYNKDNVPNEDNYTNGWLYDGIVQINQKDFENTNQKELRRIAEGLDALNKQLDKDLAASKNQEGGK